MISLAFLLGFICGAGSVALAWSRNIKHRAELERMRERMNGWRP